MVLLIARDGALVQLNATFRIHLHMCCCTEERAPISPRAGYMNGHGPGRPPRRARTEPIAQASIGVGSPSLYVGSGKYRYVAMMPRLSLRPDALLLADHCKSQGTAPLRVWNWKTGSSRALKRYLAHKPKRLERCSSKAARYCSSSSSPTSFPVATRKKPLGTPTSTLIRLGRVLQCFASQSQNPCTGESVAKLCKPGPCDIERVPAARLMRNPASPIPRSPGSAADTE